MKVEDLIQLLNNRLREFKLSQNYATMNGDLERVVEADKEIIALEDTLFKLSLLVDTSKSAAVKEAVLAETITDGSVSVLGEYDITPYATDPLHEEKIMNILSNMGLMDTTEQIDNYIKGSYISSPVTGEMVMSAALAYAVDARLMMAIMEQDSRFGTAGLATSTLNPGNVGNDDDGNTRTYDSWQEGVTAVAEWLSRHRILQGIPEETVLEPATTPLESGEATSTPSVITPTDTTTASTTTSTIITTSPESGSATTTPSTITSTTTATTTPAITPVEEPAPLVISTSTTTPSTIITSTTTATTTPVTVPVEEPVPTTTSISTTTPSTTTSTTTATTTF